MTGRWHFKPLFPGDTTRDPITGEFFSTDAIKNPAEALVREAVQNSLDAKAGDAPVRIRFYMPDAALDATVLDPFLTGLPSHLGARGNGLSAPPSTSSSCRFMVVEDFGTSGLTGDVSQWRREETANRFFAFFRAEGESDKSGNDRGRWGVGKFVFPRSSEGSAFFGFTRRDGDSNDYLLGRAILKSHSVGGVQHVPDGYFGVLTDVERGKLTMPITDPRATAHFRNTFNVSRVTEPGLSIVIPWLSDEITREKIRDAAIRDYFYSILLGELEISIEQESGSQRLAADTIDECLALCDAKIQQEMEPLFRLTRFVLSISESDIVPLLPADTTGAAKWSADTVPPELAASLRGRLQVGETIVLRLPIAVKVKKRGSVASSFMIVLVRDPLADDARPLFVREGIVVSDARGSRIRGHRALVLCQAGAIATLLGDAENPSHTEWRVDSANLKGRYTYGPSYVRFVQESVGQLVRALYDVEDDRDRELLLDLFFVNASTEDAPVTPAKKKPAPGQKPIPPVPPVLRSAPRFRLERIAGGFSVQRAGETADIPKKLRVRAAYDVRRGNPFKKYERADFEFLKGGIEWVKQPVGLDLVTADGNALEFTITDPDFAFAVGGFDENRDLIVDVRAEGDDDD